MTTLDKALKELLERDPRAKTEPVFIMRSSPFMDSTIFFYQKGKFYEGQKKVVREFLAQRSIGFKPDDTQIQQAVERLKTDNPGIIFNINVCHHYGSWVVEGEKITSKKLYDKEFLDMKVETIIELGHIKLNS